MNILVCNDRAEPLDQLIDILRSDSDVASLTIARDGRQALQTLNTSPVDISLTSGHGIDFNRALQRHIDPTIAANLTKVVATNSASVPLIVKAHQWGYDDLISLDLEPSEIVPALQRSIQGESSLHNHPVVKTLHLHSVPLHNEVQTESTDDRNIAQLIGVGLTDVEISEVLTINVQTIRNRISQILRINGLRNRTQLALMQNTTWQIPDFL